MNGRGSTNWTLLICTCTALTVPAWKSVANQTLEVKGAAVASHNDVIYLSPAREGWEGLPLGNGRFGAQVWQPDGLMFQFNTPLSGAYGGAIARLQFRTTPSMLTGLTAYRQRLSLGTASLRTDISTGPGDVHMRCFTPAGIDALILEVEDERAGDIERFVELEAWRDTASRIVEDETLLISDVLTFPGEPDYRYAMAVGIDRGTVSGERADEHTLRLRVGGRDFCVYAAFFGTRQGEVDVLRAARDKLKKLKVLAQTRFAHEKWWRDFWSRSFVQLASEDGVADYLANLWYMHVYAMACGSRGEVPPKFNGGLWTDERDKREWGKGYWHWNTQETYWPLYAANHLELLAPYYNMYFRMLPNVERQTKDYFGIGGAQYPETCMFDGTDATGKGPKVMGVHERLPVPKTFTNANMILSSSAEIAMQFWWYYLYTGDATFLREKAYPVMSSAAEFLLGYLSKDKQGRYYVYPSNAHETFLAVKNPTTDLAAIRYLLPSLIEASRILDGDADRRGKWQEVLDHLAPYPINEKTGGIGAYEPLPSQSVKATNAENPELFPVGVFPLITLGSPAHDLGVRTFLGRSRVNVYGWTTDSICAARLGLADQQRDGLHNLLPNHAERYQDHPSGLMDYYTRRPAIHPYLEGSGTFATALGEMLLQSWNQGPNGEPVIRICPALPQAWSARFKLLAMGGFVVTGAADGGKPFWVSIYSQRGGTALVANPFGERAVVTGGKTVAFDGDAALLRLETRAGQTYTLVPSSALSPKVTLLSTARNDAPKRLERARLRVLGKPEMASLRWVPPEEPDAPAPPTPPAGEVDRPMNPEVKAARFDAPPTINGDLSEECWENASLLRTFMRLAKRIPAKEQTDVKIGYDEKALYLGITCWESHMDSLQLEYLTSSGRRDGPVYKDDSIEIFLQTMPGAFWHLAVNALGAVFDSRGPSPAQDESAFNPNWKVATSRKSNRWTVEAELPFDSFAPFPPGAGESWGFNVCRNERPHGEVSTWAALSRPSFHLPGDFGRLVFPTGEAIAEKQPLVPGLVGYWPFDETKGGWLLDVSGHGNHAAMTLPMKLVEGKVGKALEFTGAGFVEVADSPELNLTDAMTLMAWVYPRRRGSMRIIDKSPAGGSDAYLLDTHPDNHVRVITRAATMGSEADLPVNEWSHVATTFGGGMLRIYINGELKAEKRDIKGKLTATRLPLRIGADSRGGSRLVGLMDEVKVWRRALDAEEVRRSR